MKTTIKAQMEYNTTTRESLNGFSSVSANDVSPDEENSFKIFFLFRYLIIADVV
jgi:hypothetical protein